jgi:predicted phage-related endonuclease
MPVITRVINDCTEWLEWRKHDVTASVIGALFDCHPYVTALRLYAEKRGAEFPQQDENKSMRRGRWLEPAVARAVSEMRPEWELTEGKIYNSDPELRLGCTPDYFIRTTSWIGVLQIKTVAPSVFKRDWEDGPPLWIILQAATEMLLCDAKFGAVAAMVVDPHNMDVHIFDIPRNPDAEQKIRQRVAQFWHDVDAGNEPQPQYDRDRDVIRALRPQETKGRTVDLSANNELPDMLARRAMLKKQIELAEAACEAIEAEVSFWMGDAAEMVGVDGWKITYKTMDRAAYHVPAKRMRVLRIYDRREESAREII